MWTTKTQSTTKSSVQVSRSVRKAKRRVPTMRMTMDATSRNCMAQKMRCISSWSGSSAIVISPCDVMRCMRAVPEHMKTATARTRKFSMFAW